MGMGRGRESNARALSWVATESGDMLRVMCAYAEGAGSNCGVLQVRLRARVNVRGCERVFSGLGS